MSSGRFLPLTLPAALLLAGALACVGCATTPPTITQGPSSARALPPPGQTSAGGIYNAASYRPLFEDRRPRFVGDTLTINIVENTSAAKNGANAASKSGEVDGSIGAYLGRTTTRGNFSASSEVQYDDQASANASNRFSGSIAVTVVEVLPNGHLMVAGEKQIAFDRGTEFVRLSGVVNPDSIAPGNFVASNRVADARIEYRSNSRLDSTQVMSILTRFFLSFIPL